MEGRGYKIVFVKSGVLCQAGETHRAAEARARGSDGLGMLRYDNGSGLLRRYRSTTLFFHC